MNDTELNEIEKRAANATPGPWIGDRNDGTIKYKMMGGLDGQSEVLVVDHKNGESGFYCGDEVSYEQGEANEEFVKHARQDIPALIAEVRRLTAENARLRALNKEITELFSALQSQNARLYVENAQLRAELAEMAHPTDAEIIADNDRLRAALEFYANDKSYSVKGNSMYWTKPVLIDSGDIARNALKGGDK